MRRLIALPLFAALLVPAYAQDKPISVYFQPCRDQQLNDAITEALSKPPFILAARPMTGAMVVSILGGLDFSHDHINGYTISFDVGFSLDGSSRGQSAEICNESKLSDCTDQLVSDVKSAAAMAQGR